MTEELIRISHIFPAWIWNIIVLLFSLLLGLIIKVILIPIVRKQTVAPIILLPIPFHY